MSFECFLLKTGLSGCFGNLCSPICCNSEIMSLEQYREECCSLCRPVECFLMQCENIVGNARSQIHLIKCVVSWSGHYQIFWEQGKNRTHKLGVFWQGMTSLLLEVICLWSWGFAVKRSMPVPAVTEMGEEEAAWLCENGEMAVDSSCWVKHWDSSLTGWWVLWLFPAWRPPVSQAKLSSCASTGNDGAKTLECEPTGTSLMPVQEPTSVLTHFTVTVLVFLYRPIHT